MRKTPLSRSTPLARSGRPLPAVNRERQAKRIARRRKERREVDGPHGRRETLERDGFRCCCILDPDDEYLPKLEEFATGDMEPDYPLMRCGVQGEDEVEEHHVRYRAPSIRITACIEHHHYLEARIRWYKRNRR
jgi:hypothetical protein